MSRRLHIQVEGGSPVELPRSGVLSIGSASDADLIVDGPGVASAHCVIGRIKGGGWAIKDLGSTAGTLVNGKRVQQVRLAAGDEVVLGARRLAVVDPRRATADAPLPVAEPPGMGSDARGRTSPNEGGSETFASPEARGYRIERRLGHGGMGSVFLAVQESLDRKVALKVLNPRLSADTDFVQRFQAEARAAAALSHPNVVTVHDVWEEHGHHWLSMEFMERGNLEDRVARAGRIDPDEVVQVLLEAAKGLQFAELRGIVHRDIKPANLMQDALGLTKIADLGLATQLEAEASQAGDTRIFGTPHFISPEQARGESVDGRSDLYSLGATAYRLLSGRTPFEGQTTRDILRGHLTAEPRPLREFAPGVSPELEALVAKLLSKQPEDRYQTASELIEALETLRAGGPQGGGGKLLLGGLLAAAAVGAVAFVLLREPREGGAEQASRAVEADPEAPVAPVSPGDLAAPADPTGAGAGGAGAGGAGRGGPEGPGSGATVDDDSALKALEARALAAYAELPSDLAPDERQAALGELVQSFAGTTAASGWQRELDALSAALAAQGQERVRLDEQSEGVLTLIRGAFEPDERSLDQVAAALRSISVPPRLAADPGFARARVQALRQGLGPRLAAARAAGDALEALAAAGEFDRLRADLEAQLARLAVLPESQPLEGDPLLELEEWEALVALREAGATRLAQLDREADAWRIAREHGDARRLAQSLFEGGPVDAALARLDLAGAETGLARLADELDGTGSATFAAALAADVRAARAALDALASAFANGDWRRKSILDPRTDGQRTTTVVGVEPDGLMVGDGGDLELLPWSAFAGDPDALDQLFRQRLSRDYDARELGGIAALMRIAAVQRAVTESEEMLGGGPAILTEGELEAMLSGFEVAAAWNTDSADRERLASELEGARRLAASLSASGRGAWSSAVAEGERLMAEHRDTLLVRLISDGSPWLQPAPIPAVAAPGIEQAPHGSEPPPAEPSAPPEGGSDGHGESAGEGDSGGGAEDGAR